MAAFMRSGQFLTSRFVRTYAKQRRVRDGGFYILLPEVPPDTPETNPLLRRDTFPQFSQISPDKVVTGCAKVAIEYEVELDKHVARLQESETERTFENVISPVDNLCSLINFPFFTAKNLSFAKGGDFYKAYQRVGRQMSTATDAKWTSPVFYNMVKEVASRGDSLTDSQRRLLKLYLFDAKMAGLEASDEEEKRLLRSIQRLGVHKQDFRIRVESCERLFSHTITDFDVIAEMPKSLAKLMVNEGASVSRGPWTLSLHPTVYNAVLQYCRDPTLRWLMYDAYINRSSRRFISKHLDNHMRIGDIREHRKLIAIAHGYETFSDLMIANNMATSVDNVLNLLGYYKPHFKPVAAEEFAEVQTFAQSKGSGPKLEMWDLPYWRRRHREHLYPHYNTPTVWEYFPYKSVLSRLFDLCSQLFGITIEDHTEEVELWEKHIIFYKVFDTTSGQHLGSFYLDPFQRPGKAPMTWSENGRERNIHLGVTPIMYVHMRLPLPVLPDQPVLMDETNLMDFLEVFGNVLRFTLDTCPYSELTTMTGMEVDAMFIIPKLFLKLFTSKPLLRQLSAHVDSGAAIGEQVLDSMVGGSRHLQNYDMTQQLYQGAFDMELCLTDDYWMDVKQKVWDEFLPVPHSMDDESPCGMNSLFTDKSAGLHYSPVWSDMVASDLFKVFSDAGLEDLDKLTTVGLRFREHYLSHGNGLSGNEAFRRFTGRDPALESMVEYYTHPT